MTTFIDSVTLFAAAGKGGDGCVSVKREKFKPLGGPDGGNGGRGGDIILVVDSSVTTLLDFHHSPHRKATSGHQGYGDRKDGVSGEDLILPVPNGTVIYDEDGEQIADLIGIGTTFLAARGGHGGLQCCRTGDGGVARAARRSGTRQWPHRAGAQPRVRGRPGAGLHADLHFHGGGAGPQTCRSFPGEKSMMRNTLSAWFAAILVALLIAGVGRALFPDAHESLAFGVLILSITLTGWVQYARTVRGTTLVERNKEYVQAARVTGVAPLRIMIRHVLPNVLGPVMVLATIQVATAIITEATLSFLGVGVPPTSPSLGTLIRIGNDFLFSGEWWITIFPGVTLVLIALSVNLLGDWLRDALNPRLR